MRRRHCRQRDRQARHAAEQGRRQTRRERIDVVLAVAHVDVDDIGNPAGQLEAARLDRIGSQQRVVEAAEPQADYHHHRQSELLRQVSGIGMRRQRYVESAHAFHHNRLRLRRDLRIAIEDAADIDGDVFLHGGDMRRGGGAQQVGRGQLARQVDVGCVGKQVGVFKSIPKPRAHLTQLNEKLDWAALAKEGSIQHLQVDAGDVGTGDTSRPYMDLYFGYLNAPSIGISVLGEHGYHRLMDDLKPDEHAIFVIATGQVSFKGSGFVRGGIYDRIQVRQDSGSFTFRDTDYQNLYHLEPADAPSYKESGIFIVRSANFNPAYPW